MTDFIDFVITWVDGNDPDWLRERNYYAKLENTDVDNSNVRYRDWGTLRYWFRGLEKFAPWVNKIFFVTWGHVPEWLDTKNPKLQIVKHSEFIPVEYLPTFNSNVIEFYFHRIEGLSDRFVYFNDDTFLIDRVAPSRFFHDGFPCDVGALMESNHKGMFGLSVYLAKCLINEHFNKRKSVLKNLTKWFNFAYPFFSFRNIVYLMIRTTEFNGFEDHHLPQGYLKKTYDEVWYSCVDDLIRTSKSKFRQYGDVASWLLRYWQLASGYFSPKNPLKDGICFYNMDNEETSKVVDYIRYQKKSIILINDSDQITDFEMCKSRILKAFEEILPDKSSFELNN